MSGPKHYPIIGSEMIPPSLDSQMLTSSGKSILSMVLSTLLSLLITISVLSCKPVELPFTQSTSDHQAIHLPSNNASDRVNAHAFHSFWLWGNVSPKPYLTHRSTPAELYILQGEVGRSRLNQHTHQFNISQHVSVLENQGMGLCHIESAKIWLVYRTTTLNWHPHIMAHIVARLQSWKNYNNQVIGLQIDFDSATSELSQYAKFLQTIRQQLPPSYQLSATGLMDWVNADPNSIFLLSSSLDEIVIQTYQGRHTIPDYQAYLPPLAKLNIPFKVGLVQHGQWQSYKPIEKNKKFKGYVVFLLSAPP